jgi:hypothetical protein
MAYVQDLWYNVLSVVTAKDTSSFGDTGPFASESGGNEKGEDDEVQSLFYVHVYRESMLCCCCTLSGLMVVGRQMLSTKQMKTGHNNAPY